MEFLQICAQPGHRRGEKFLLGNGATIQFPAQRGARRIKPTIIVALLALTHLVGCGDVPPNDPGWADYQQRLERLLDRRAEPLSDSPPPRYPRQRSLQLSFTAPDINLLEFLRLRRCRLAETLAQRNSILGRQGDATAHLLFDLAFLEQVDACTASLNKQRDQDLIAALALAKTIKIQQLPGRLFAAGPGGPEFRQLWAPPARQRPYPQGEDQALLALARWQQWQTQWLAGNWQHHADAVVATLGEIRLGLGGDLLQAQQRANGGLLRASTIIRQRLTGRPLCLQPRPTPAARHFMAALQKHFIARIQPWASQVNRHQLALLNVINPIEDALFAQMRARGQAPPPDYLRWQNARNAYLDSVLQDYRDHVDAAGQLLQQCGLQPGQATTD